MSEFYTDPLVTLLHGDCIEVMATLPADSVDAVVTDPPYGLEFMGKAWDKFLPESAARGRWKDPASSGHGLNAAAIGASTPGGRSTVSYHGRRTTSQCQTCGKRDAFRNEHGHADWATVWVDAKPLESQAFQAWCEQWGREALRVTKPGGYLLAFGGTRTHHRLVCALEDAGWIIRDELDWIYASGFPKGKANLKPAHEPIVLARKPGPLRPLAIDECRIGTPPKERGGTRERVRGYVGIKSEDVVPANPPDEGGRWPSNVLLSDPELFDEPNPYVVGSGAVTTTPAPYVQQTHETGDIFPLDKFGTLSTHHGDSGGYSRFFIVPKADRAERERGLAERPKADGEGPLAISQWEGQTNGSGNTMGPTAPRANIHPTVKPIDLMRHLVRLVTPSGGTVLDPFLGSGTTCLAASEEGFRSIGIEREAEYLEIAKDRLIATPMGLGLSVDPMPEEVA